MDADVRQVQPAGWVFVEEEGWPGVDECGAIFVPDREMRFDVNDDDDWPVRGSC